MPRDEPFIFDNWKEHITARANHFDASSEMEHWSATSIYKDCIFVLLLPPHFIMARDESFEFDNWKEQITERANGLHSSLIKLDYLLPKHFFKAWTEDNYGHIKSLILRFLAITKEQRNFASTHITSGIGGQNPLDLYRRSLVTPNIAMQGHIPREHAIDIASFDITAASRCPCALELKEAGIYFKKGQNGSIFEILFNSKNGALTLPLLVVDNYTECTLLNMVVFEQMIVKTYPYMNLLKGLSFYICIMDEIINTAGDIRLLRQNDIIMNFLGSDEDVAKLFKGIAKNIIHHDSQITKFRSEVLKYCHKRRNRWRASLMHTYFKSPWSFLSLVGALLLIALALIQVITPFLKN